MKYVIDSHLFAKKLRSIVLKKGMIDKKGEPDKIALYNLLEPNNQITEELCKQDRQKVTDMTRKVSNWLKGNSYPKSIADVLVLCNVLDCDLDYFFTDMESPTHDIAFIKSEIGLSINSVEMLKILSDYKNKYQTLFPELGSDIDALNAMLEYQHYCTKKANEKGAIAGWSIFHYIKQYLSSGVFERELQDRLRIRDGSTWVDVENGDILQKNDKQYTIASKTAINSETGCGNDSRTLNVVNTKKPSERYTLEVDKIFSSYSKDNIFRELDKIKDFLESTKPIEKR